MVLFLAQYPTLWNALDDSGLLFLFLSPWVFHYCLSWKRKLITGKYIFKTNTLSELILTCRYNNVKRINFEARNLCRLSWETQCTIYFYRARTNASWKLNKSIGVTALTVPENWQSRRKENTGKSVLRGKETVYRVAVCLDFRRTFANQSRTMPIKGS